VGNRIRSGAQTSPEPAVDARLTAGVSETAIEVRGVTFAYGWLQVLFGVDLTVTKGEIVGLLGTNGAGKSTLLRVLVGLSLPNSGSVRINGRDVTRLPAEERVGLGVGLVSGGKAVFRDLTVRENLDVGTHRARAKSDRQIDRVLELFPRLKERLGVVAGAISGGEQQQLAIAKALLIEPTVLCIDELSLGLAPNIVERLLEVVRTLNAAGTTIVIVEQSLNVAASVCQRAVFMEKGAVVFEGTPDDLIARDDIARSVFLGNGYPAR
jgi:ABC-type branched-subunit amino acid transport system ATPase component